MKKQLLLWTLLTLTLSAKNIILTPQQEENWQIKVETPQSVSTLPLGEFVTEVVTPPSLLHTISLPFEAHVKKLNVAKYQEVIKGEVLSEVTGKGWIEIQKRAIADAIKFRHDRYLTERKNMLCKDGIIPQKECVTANAALKDDKIKVAASKALLKSYGASDAMISTLFEALKLSQNIEVQSTVKGRIVQLHATPGKSTSPADALFVIQEKGLLWLESDIEAKRTQELTEGQKVQITLGKYTFDTTILQLSPVINPENQTRHIRFLVPSEIQILPGLRSSAKITLSQESLKIRKTSVIKNGEAQIVFIKSKEGYTAVPVEILAENDTYYFVKPSSELKNAIAVSSVAILKNMLGEDDE